MPTLEYDLVAIGGGAGGLYVAGVANSLGFRSAIAEKKKLGGDCTWYGCIPSKTLLKSAGVAQTIRRAQHYGFNLAGAFQIDAGAVLAQVRRVVAEVATHHRPEDLRARGIGVHFGPVHFTSAHSIAVDGQEIKAKRFVLCTGSHPVIPPIEGLGDIEYLTNENIFDQERLPKSLIVLGGGPIGVELAQALGRLGVCIHLVEMQPTILSQEEPELVQYLERQLTSEGMTLHLGCQANRFIRQKDQVTLQMTDEKNQKLEIIAQKVLVATGRAPNLEGLDLPKAGIERTPKGIKVNDFLQTSNPGIFVCGDLASPYQFSHVAAYQGSICLRNALFKRIAWQKVDYTNIAWATFTSPELAHLGQTEMQVQKEHRRYQVYKTEYASSDRALTDGVKDGLIKILTDKRGLLLGVHIVGEDAGEIIHGFVIAKSQRIVLSRLASTMFIYPTLSELVKKTAGQSLKEMANRGLVKFLLKSLKGI